MCVCVCNIYVCIYAYVYTHTIAQTHTHTHTRTHTHTPPPHTIAIRSLPPCIIQFQEHTLDKIREVRQLLTLVRGDLETEEGGKGKEGGGGQEGRRSCGQGAWIMVDGGINVETARACAAAGADALVAGICCVVWCGVPCVMCHAT